MVNLLDKLRKLVRAEAQPEGSTAVPQAVGPLTMNETAVMNLMRQVEETQEDQYSCAETFALLDEYVEMVTSEEDASALMPLVERHIHACPDCSERFEALLAILKSEQR